MKNDMNLDTNSLISVVMPTYNQARFISYSIDSVLNQTFENWELLIVDNFSSDETSEVLAHYSDPRIRVFKIDNGGVIARSRNLAIEASKGNWIAFLDSDDYWFPKKLERVAKLFNSNPDLIYHNMKVVNGKNYVSNKEFIKSRKLRKPILKDLIVNGNTIVTSSVVVRKKLLEEVNCMNVAHELIGIEDYNTWLRISRKTEAFKLIPQELGAYRRHEKNVSLSNSLVLPIEAFKEFMPLISERDKRKLNFNQLYTVARLKYLNKNPDNLKKELRYLLLRGRVLHKVKSFWMLMNLFRN
jgi:glycosyltransferase involved in cell wall biosynthesis